MTRDATKSSGLEERFVLTHSDGAIRCPAPAASLSFVVLDDVPEVGTDGTDDTTGTDGSTTTDGATGDDGQTGTDGQDTTDDGETDATTGANFNGSSSTGCTTAGHAQPSQGWVFLFLMFGGWAYARRRSLRTTTKA